MPKPRKKERIVAQYFTWLLGQRNGIFVADGRSNEQDIGRHTLGTRDRHEALEELKQLDAVKAVEFGLADRSILVVTQGDDLSLDEGRQLYLAHAARPSVLRGTAPTTVKRYRAILDKFVAFAKGQGVQTWRQAANKRMLEGYVKWLENEGYSYATEYIELTTIKQMIGWLVQQGRLPAECKVVLPLRKPQGSSTYCYTPEEVAAILARCYADAGLKWLGDVVVALTRTGLRIGELAKLRSSDLHGGVIRLLDTSTQGTRFERAQSRTTKSHRDRELPIHDDLQEVLRTLKVHADGRVFHGPRGGRLKPDTVRNVLIRDVLMPLAERFPALADEKGLADGRLHSFRHFFCSASANAGVSEQAIMAWLGHQDSKMVRRYYHLHQEEARRQMAKIKFETQGMGSEKQPSPGPGAGVRQSA